MLEKRILEEIKQELEIIDDTKDSIIEKYYSVVNMQITEYIFNSKRTEILRSIEKAFVISKMKAYNKEYNPFVEKTKGLDFCIKDKPLYMNVLDTYRRIGAVNNKNIRAVREQRQKRGVEND